MELDMNPEDVWLTMDDVNLMIIAVSAKADEDARFDALLDKLCDIMMMEEDDTWH